MSNPVCQTTLAFHSHTQITARFDGGNLTSDAGWLLFGSLDRQDRLCEDFSSCIADSRDQRYVRHEQLKLIRQRVFQIVAGYEDCNDADTLRSDPMLKTVCDQLPESDPDLATQATFSRLENSVSKKDLMRLSRGFLQRYVRSLKKRRPDPVILDLDSTDDHTHGQQEFSFLPRLLPKPHSASFADLRCRYGGPGHCRIEAWKQGGCLSHRSYSETNRESHSTRSWQGTSN